MGQLLKIYPENPQLNKINEVVETLKKGGIIIYPTDTVYGMGCDFSNKGAIERMAQLKGIKPKDALFSFVCNDLSHISDYCKQIDTYVYKILKRGIPGPFTFILEGAKTLPNHFKARKEVGIRVPAHPIPQLLVELLGVPITSTSIRDEDEIIEYTTNPELIYEKWGDKVDYVIDSGLGGNVASTVIDLTSGDIELIRQGLGEIEVLY